MYTKWTQHISDPEQKSRFENTIISSRPVLDRLKELLKEEERGLDRSEIDIKTFDQPNWEFRQAYKNGYRSSLNILMKLIDLDQQNTEIKPNKDIL